MEEYNNEIVKENLNQNKKKSNKLTIILSFLIVLVLAGAGIYFFILKKDTTPSTPGGTSEVKKENKYSQYQLKSNTLEDFDLYFMQLENNNKNMIYSPLSIKYALELLNEGAEGDTKEQITNILGSYTNKKYQSNQNMSFANALFIRNNFKDNINQTYIDTLNNTYNAQVVYDDFKNPKKINNWVSNKTYNLINNLYDNISDQDFILANALGIDMEWVKKIQADNYEDRYAVSFDHEDFNMFVGSLDDMDYTELKFENLDYKAKATKFGAVINKYDIVSELGEDNIRKTVNQAYQKWLTSDEYCGDDFDNTFDMEKYIAELKDNYEHISSSTDFEFYTDEDTKVFAKDLKTYNDTTLQYIGIMPTTKTLSDYIKNTNAEKLNTLIGNLKSIKLANFKDGVITRITGYVPMFKFDYKLNLVKDLNTLGITDVFDKEKANLSKLSSADAYINDARHQANIEFSNEGIKAAAATSMGGAGSVGCWFDYRFDVPVEEIDLTFDKPYMFIIRDKNSGEVWFMGGIYEPTKFTPNLGE